MMDEKQIGMIDELLNAESGLSGWEMDFIEDLDKRRDRPLSDKQADKLADIWEKVNP